MRYYLPIFLVFVFQGLMGQQHPFMISEDREVPAYKLPDLLTTTSGDKISTSAEWPSRRKELIGLFEKHMYGKAPARPKNTYYQNLGESNKAIHGLAKRKEIRVIFSTENGIHEMTLLMYLPKKVEGKIPIVLGLNFYGNQSIYDDPEIRMPKGWVRNNEGFGITNNIATEASRGVRSHRWPVQRILERGYGLATIYYGDLDPDRSNNFQDGVHPLFYKKGQSKPKISEWGAIGAWAWGLQRAMDYLETDADVDPNRVIVFGHSRLGKAALWSAALDERFAMTISNNSGCGGAALSRRGFGETINVINTMFPHWFNDYFVNYNNKEDLLPIDQHCLMALLAPRPVYVASAEDDDWADPKGEFLSLLKANLVYDLFGFEGLPVDKMPKTNQSVMGTTGYHIREGGHDVTDYDWERYLDFADSHFK